MKRKTRLFLCLLMSFTFSFSTVCYGATEDSLTAATTATDTTSTETDENLLEEAQEGIGDELSDATTATTEESLDSSEIQTESNDLDTETTQSDMSDSLSSLYDMMDQSILNGDDMNLSDMLLSINGSDEDTCSLIQSSLFDGITSESTSEGYSTLWDTIDYGTVNMNYTIAATEMMEDYDSIDLSGKSSESQQFFAESYGDILSEYALDEATLPDGWDASSMISSISSNIDDTYSDAISSDSFSSIKNSISTSSIFKQAASGASSYSLKSSSSLSNLMSNYTTDASSQYVDYTSSDAYTSAKSKLSSQYNMDDLKESYENAPTGATSAASDKIGKFSKSIVNATNDFMDNLGGNDDLSAAIRGQTEMNADDD